MLISVHLPKTAGSSFAKSLQEHFGGELLMDYSDLPLHKRNVTRNLQAIAQNIQNTTKDYSSINAIHGHFLPYKYLSLSKRRSCTFVTWLRDPAERIASQYFYMKRHYSADRAAQQPLLRRMVEEGWSLERFCLAPELKNTYAKFFWHFPVKMFQFIGVVDNYESDLRYFSQHHLSAPLQEFKKNKNPDLQKRSYFEDKHFKEQILAFHNKDNTLYLDALKKSNSRANTC